MFTYTVRYRMFANAFIEKAQILANDRLEAEAMILGMYPHGKILSAELAVAEPVVRENNVIYVDFQARKRIA